MTNLFMCSRKGNQLSEHPSSPPSVPTTTTNREPPLSLTLPPPLQQLICRIINRGTNSTPSTNFRLSNRTSLNKLEVRRRVAPALPRNKAQSLQVHPLHQRSLALVDAKLVANSTHVSLLLNKPCCWTAFGSLDLDDGKRFYRRTTSITSAPLST